MVIQKKEANKNLELFNSDAQNLPKLKFFLEESKNSYVQYLVASAMKQLLTDHWLKIPITEKVAIKEYLIAYFKSDLVLKQEK